MSDERLQVRWVDGGYQEVVVPWSQTASGRALAVEQLDAAHLFAALEGDVTKVEAILGLEAGTVQVWWDEDTNFQEVAVGIARDHYPEEPTGFDFSLVLKPKQLDAARLYYEEALTQVEVALRVEVTDRTIRNWAADPAFRYYGMQLRRATEARLREELIAQDKQIVESLAQQRRLALGVLAEAIEGKDVKVAIELLRPWLKER